MSVERVVGREKNINGSRGSCGRTSGCRAISGCRRARGHAQGGSPVGGVAGGAPAHRMCILEAVLLGAVVVVVLGSMMARLAVAGAKCVEVLKRVLG